MISKRKIFTIPILLICLFAINAFAENSPPVRSIITHAHGESKPGEQVLFSTWYIDPDGWDDLKYARFIIGATINSRDCFYGEYRISTDLFKIWDDVNNKWIEVGYTPGSSNIIENDYTILDCSKSVVSGSGITLRVTWAITFKDSTAGEEYNTYLYAKDNQDERTPWNKEGSWRVKAKIPRIVRFQGMLKNFEGTVIDENVLLTFRLYETNTGGPLLWEETQQGVEIEDGLLDAELGNSEPLDNLAFDKQYWLGVEINNDGEMAPRFRLTGMPYAFKSDD